MSYAILYHPRTYHEANYRYYYIPFSIVSIATTLSKALPCLMYDNNVLRCESPEDLDLPSPEEWGLVCVSAMIGMQILDALRFSQYIRRVRPDCPIIWGGACPTLLPECVLREAPADAVVIGQGEVSILEAWTAFGSGQPLTSIPGLALMVDGKPTRTQPRPLADLNGLPPYRDFYARIGVQQYVRPDEHIGTRTVNYHSSQGCPFTCGFCCEPVLWSNRWTGMSGARIVEDIIPLVEEYGVNGVKFYDSEFFIRRERALDYAAEVCRRGIGLKWGASIHPRNLLRFTESELQLLKRSGLSRLLMGAETGNATELRLINKQLDRAAVLGVAGTCARLGIAASFTFVTGYPGSPPSFIDETLDFAEELASISKLHEAKVHFYGPYPGTPLYPLALSSGFVPPRSLLDWARYDYYTVNTPWIPAGFLEKVRTFNESHYPYLLGEEMS